MAAHKLRVIAICTIPTFVLFLGLNLWVNTIPNTVELTFDGTGSKYSILKGNVSLILSNDSPKNTLHVSLLDGKSNLSFSSSNLFESKSGSIIKSDDVTFNNSALLPIPNLSSVANNVIVSVKTDEAGLFYGTLNIFSHNDTHIAITVDVKPDFLKIAMSVANGLAVSVVILNVIGYLFLDRKQEKTKKAISEIAKYAYLAQNQFQELQADELASVRPSLDSVISKLVQSNPNSAYKELMNLQDNNYKIYGQANIRDIHQREQARNLKQGIRIANRQEYLRIFAQTYHPKTDFSLKKYITTSVIEKNVIAGITGVAFGLIVGFIPLLQSDYINGLRQLEFTDYMILFGLGVGIGNLNEAISKIWEKSKNGEKV